MVQYHRSYQDEIEEKYKWREYYMRLIDLFHLGTRYAIEGCVVAIFVIIAFFIGYKLIYQKCLHGTKRISKWKAIWLIVFIVYGVVLVGATFLSRGGSYSRAQIVPPFASYKEAWYQGRMSNVRNIVVNILLFVPLGFLLPIGLKRIRPYWKTALVGGAVTVLIECLQLVTKRGIFECDDIINNLVGILIGYGIFAFINWILNKEKKKNVLRMMVCQLPLVFGITIMIVLCTSYNMQELGNLSIHYITKVPASKFEITTELSFDSSDRKAPVYQVKNYSLSETRELAESIFGRTGTTINDDETDLYDDTVFYRGDKKHISIDYSGGLYSYTDFEATFSEGQLTEKADASDEEVKEALSGLGVEIPEEAIFHNTEDGKYTFIVETYEKEGKIYDGQLTCTLMDNGIISQINNRIYVCTQYKDFDIISEEQAYQKIKDGEFLLFFEKAEKKNISIQSVSLGYMLDSKSFYQPVYYFDVEIDGGEYQIQIPAVK